MSRTRHNVQLTQMTCLCGILLSAKLKAAQTLRASFVAQLRLTVSWLQCPKDISGCAFCGRNATRNAIKNGTKRSSNVDVAAFIVQCIED